jgi:hypothetical protein
VYGSGEEVGRSSQQPLSIAGPAEEIQIAQLSNTIRKFNHLHTDIEGDKGREEGGIKRVN